MSKICIFFLFLSFAAQAQIPSSAKVCLDLFAYPPMELAQERPLLFKNVEVYRRNNQIGIQQLGDIQFEKWIEIKPYTESVYNYIGITAEGRVYHLIDWPGRKIARLLSGQKNLEDIFLLRDQILAARDSEGRIYLYQASRWSQSPRREAMKRGFKIWAGLSGALTLGLYALVPDALHWNAHFLSMPVPIPAVFVSAVTALQTSFVMLSRYEHFNTYPDGFVATAQVYTGPLDTETSESLISDDVLNTFQLGEDLQTPNPKELAPPLPAELSEGIH